MRDLIGERVRVYLHIRKGVFSVQVRHDDGRWRVAAHVEEIHLRDVEFRVSAAGRARVLREGVKNVHAKVHGIVSDDVRDRLRDIRVRYNPYETETFVETTTGDPVFESPVALMRDRQVWI